MLSHATLLFPAAIASVLSSNENLEEVFSPILKAAGSEFMREGEGFGEVLSKSEFKSGDSMISSEAGDCGDTNPECGEIIRENGCKKDSIFMKENCAYSCHMCPGGSFRWVCNEYSESCKCKTTVRYGTKNLWLYKGGGTAEFACTNDYFGKDPAPGKGKECQCLKEGTASE